MKLKPCPFCGSEKIQKHTYALKYQGLVPIIIECKNCGASTSFQISDAWKEKKVSAAWNRRADD